MPLVQLPVSDAYSAQASGKARWSGPGCRENRVLQMPRPLKAERIPRNRDLAICPCCFTRMERAIIQAILEDSANKSIAGRLHVSERTVKFHVSNVLRKFKVHKKADLLSSILFRREDILHGTAGCVSTMGRG